MTVRLYPALVLLLTLILTVSAGCTRTANNTPEDAREFAVLLVTKAEEGDWQTLQRLLVPEFQGYNEDALRSALNTGGSVSNTLWPSFRSPDQWQEERHSEFTIVRVIKFPHLALVLRGGAGGEWRLDPGPYALALAEAFQKGIDINEIIPRNYSAQVQTNADRFQLARRFSNELMNVAVNGDNVNLTWQVTLTRVSEAQIPLAGLSWQAGDKSGPVQVGWTTAMITESTLLFPGVEEGQGGASTRYLVTFSLEEVPPEAETIELEVKDVVLDGMTFSVRYSLNFPI